MTTRQQIIGTAAAAAAAAAARVSEIGRYFHNAKLMYFKLYL